MTDTFRTKLLIFFLVLSGSVQLDAREPDSKKLQVFILAGQSNMVGHANYITIPRLFADERQEVQELAGLVFNPGTNVTRAAVDAQIAVRIERDAINNQIRKKEIVGEQQIAAAFASFPLTPSAFALARAARTALVCSGVKFAFFRKAFIWGLTAAASFLILATCSSVSSALACRLIVFSAICAPIADGFFCLFCLFGLSCALVVMDVMTSNRTVVSVVNLNIVISPNLLEKRGSYNFLSFKL